MIENNLIKANQGFSHDYSVADEVLKLTHNPSKLEEQAQGPIA